MKAFYTNKCNETFLQILNNKIGQYSINKIKYLKNNITTFLASEEAFIFHNLKKKIIFKIKFNEFSSCGDAISYKNFIFIMTEYEFVIFDTQKLKILKSKSLKSILNNYWNIYSINLLFDPFKSKGNNILIETILEIQYKMGAKKNIFHGQLKLNLNTLNIELYKKYTIDKQEKINNIIMERELIKYLPFITIPSNRYSIIKNQFNEQIKINGFIKDIAYNYDKDEYYLLVNRDYEVSLYILDSNLHIQKKINNIYEIIDLVKMDIIKKAYCKLDDSEKLEAYLYLEENNCIDSVYNKQLFIEYIGNSIAMIIYSNNIYIVSLNTFTLIEKIFLLRKNDFLLFNLKNFIIFYFKTEKKLIITNKKIDVINIINVNLYIENIIEISKNKILLLLEYNKIQIFNIYDRSSITYNNSNMGSLDIQYIGQLYNDLIYIIANEKYNEGNKLYIYNDNTNEIDDLGFIFIKEIKSVKVIKEAKHIFSLLINNICLTFNINDKKIIERKEINNKINSLSQNNIQVQNNLDFFPINNKQFLIIKQENNNYIIASNIELSEDILLNTIIGVCKNFELIPYNLIFDVERISKNKIKLNIKK